MKQQPLISLMLALLFMAGCTATPTAQWASQREAVTTAQDVIVNLHETGVIDDDAVRAVGPWIALARNNVNLSYAYLPDGGPQFDTLIGRARNFLSTARAALQTEQNDAATPSSDPGS